MAAALSTYLPWLVLSGDRSQTFLWYLLPTVPFLCLALGTLAAFAWSWRPVWGRIAVGGFAAVALASFVFWLPLATALPLSPDDWRSRIWFTDCGPQTLPDDTTSQGDPPPGWCWI